ncbi:tat pathway signal sequence protein [Rutstroemia sp. NJR-2017a BVV2]|nr:tat pathway signal sequence protein [Rutstroemia sp. NJR-2017a BVV2]PQE25200.1 tat pathway signal sequence protein [Rutstroemia sp. NJR-2017a BVV2]
MADETIKTELLPLPTPEEGFKPFGDEDDGTFLSKDETQHFTPEKPLSPSPSMSSIPADIPSSNSNELFIPMWRKCDGLDLLEQVEIKEKAVANAMVSLNELESALRNHTEKVWSSTKWFERIATIRASKRRCRLLVGVLGTSGSGKSSLINALLEMDDLIPADDGKACTATICEISWNSSTDPDSGFVATIERISQEDWKLELENFFEDLKEKATNKDCDADDEDLERHQRIESTFGKVKCVYPFIRSLEAMKGHSVASLLNHRNVKDILGQSKTIRSGSLRKFSDSVSRYLDSNNFKEDVDSNSFAQWPLVKVVRIEVKADILKGGIVLVDLPGTMDTNVARGALAAAYSKKLTVNCVISPTERAATDKPAQELLGSVTKRFLQLENHFSSEHLCFVITKTDSSLVHERYLRKHQIIEKDLRQVLAERERIAGQNIVMQKKFDSVKQKMAEGEKMLKQAEKERTEIQRALKKRKRGEALATTTADSSPTPEQVEMRKLLEELMEKIKNTRSGLIPHRVKQSQIQDMINELSRRDSNLESRVIAACIEHRNTTSSTTLRADFDSVRKEMGQKKSENPLKVFCVSAWAFNAFLKKEERTKGFSKLADTGIPGFQQWLNRATLDSRMRNAELFLGQIESLIDGMCLWGSDTTVAYKLLASERHAIGETFATGLKQLTASLQELNIGTVQSTKKLVKSGIFVHMPKAEATAAANVLDVVKGFAQKPVHWSTHRVINKNNGDWTSYRDIVYHWNDEMAGLYLDSLVARWRKTIHESVQEERTTYNSQIAGILELFTHSVVTRSSAICPHVVEPLYLWSQSAQRAAKIMNECVENIFENKIKTTATNAHQLVTPQVLEMWKPIYQECGEASGKGLFKRNRQIHIDFVKEKGREMYKNCSKAIRAQFNNLYPELGIEFEQSTKEATTIIFEEFNMMLENHTAKDASLEGAGGGVCPEKVKLRDKFNEIFSKLRERWDEEPTEKADEESEESEDEEIDFSRFETDNEEDGDPVVEDDENDADYQP